jgi:hypothetical protein
VLRLPIKQRDILVLDAKFGLSIAETAADERVNRVPNGTIGWPATRSREYRPAPSESEPL